MSATSNWLDASSTSNLCIQTYVQGFVDISGGNVVLRNNNLFVKTGDVSLGGRLFVTSDLSVNGKLNIGANTIPSNAIIGGAGSGGVYWTASGSTWTNGANTSKVAMILDTSAANTLDVSGTISVSNAIGVGVTNPQFQVDVGSGGVGCGRYVQWGQGSTPAYNVTTNIISGTFNGLLTTTADTSLNGRLFVSADASLNGRLFVGSDASLGARLFVNADSSLNGNVAIGGNLVVTGNLTVKQFTQQNIINTLTMNTFSVVEDVSINGRFFSSGDASLNGRLFVSGNLGAGVPVPQYALDISGGTNRSIQNTATYNNFYGKVPPSTVIPSTFSPNSVAATSSTWLNNGVTWTSSASSFDSGSGRYPYQSFDTSINNAGWGTKYPVYATTTPFGYSPGSYTTYSTYVNGVGTVSGEWLQIGSSIPVVMSSYKIYYYGTGDSAIVYIICGSNDNNNWYPIFDVSYTSWVAITSGIVGSNGLSFTIPTDNLSGYSGSSTGNGTTSCNYKYNSFGNGGNSYMYYRIIFKNLLGNGLSGGYGVPDGYCWFQEFMPVFSPGTQTGPSRTLVYMDPSNINQLDVSGSLAVVNTNATTMTVTSNTTAATNYTWNNNNVNWLASGSSYFSANYPYYAFNSLYSSNGVWATSSATYTGTGGAYNGPTTANYTTVIQGGPGTINGEWLQIQSSIPVVMNRYSFNSNPGAVSQQGRIPKAYYICGSNDGSTWYPIQYVTFTSTPVASNTATTSQSTATYTINSTTTVQTQNASTAVYCYSTSLNAYTYFRIVVTTAIYTSTLSSLTFTGDGYLCFFWTPYFIPVTSAVSLALDPGLPNQLNVGGGLNVGGALSINGALSVAGGITPIYASPSFTSGQIGYTTTATTSYGVGLTSVVLDTAIVSITLSPGVWLLNYVSLFAAANATGSKYLSAYLKAGSTEINSRTITVYNTTDNMTLCGSLVVTPATGTTYTLYVSCNPSPCNCVGGASYNYITATRIA